MASLKPSEPAILKLISDESTGWYLPSKQVDPDVDDREAEHAAGAIVSSMPFCTAGMNWRGMAPPTILSTNSKPPPRSQRLDPEEGHAELAVAAGLLLVLALGLGRGR